MGWRLLGLSTTQLTQPFLWLVAAAKVKDFGLSRAEQGAGNPFPDPEAAADEAKAEAAAE